MNHLALGLLLASGYMNPPAPIPSILDAPPSPTVRLSPDQKWLLVMERPGLPPISEVAAPELRLAGIRIDPRRYAPSRDTAINGLAILAVPAAPGPPKGRAPVAAALPQPRKIAIPAGRTVSQISFSPDSKWLAMTLESDAGLELAVADVATLQVKTLTGPKVSGVIASSFAWSGSTSLVALMRAEGSAPDRPTTPAGPAIQETKGGAAGNRTYQDLLTDPADEAIFEHYATTTPVRVGLDGTTTPIGKAGLYSRVDPSPDGRFLLVHRLSRPFSYVVPWNRFPTTIEVWSADGAPVRTVASVPLQDAVSTSFDAVGIGPRFIDWRPDAPATLEWAEALDKGNPANPAPKRDRVVALAEPFDGDPKTLVELEYRIGGMQFDGAGGVIVRERWNRNRKIRTWRVAAGGAPELIWDLSSEDRYGDPGQFVTTRTTHGNTLLSSADGKSFYLVGAGASPEGDRPFVDLWNRTTKQSTRLFRSSGSRFEQPTALLGGGKSMLLRRESASEPPNYFVVDFATKAEARVTDFKDPAPQLGELKPEVIRYKRKDGVELTGNLYLPAGYTKDKGPIPFLLWAYPQEFKSAQAAAQVSGSPYRFQRPQGASHLLLLTLGYGIFDDPSMPIIGEGDREPNDTYVEQLVSSAEAAVNVLVERGVADRRKIAIGGHSYGAFMTANLLAHSDLFAAGLARSGAYNRTLTPFGFQAEERTFWQAGDTYMKMSPFAYADRIKEPILMIHGEADNNSGTFPIQSDRFYAALKGHGATARMVFLPAESHGYRARESVGHTLYEMANWMEQHVRNRK